MNQQIAAASSVANYTSWINNMLLQVGAETEIIFNITPVPAQNFLSFKATKKPLRFQLLITNETIKLVVTKKTIKEETEIHELKVQTQSKPMWFYTPRIVMVINKAIQEHCQQK